MIKKSFGIYIVLMVSVLFVLSCSSPERASCLGENYNGFIVRWGTHNFTDTIIDGYQMDEFRRVFKIHREGSENEYKKEELGELNEERYCDLVNKINEVVLKTQTYYNPVEFSNFFEYINPVTKFRSRAVWKPDMMRIKYEDVETYGSKGYMDLFDTLGVMIKEEFEQ